MRANSKRSPKVVGIFGHYGNLNLGDEAIVAAVIQNVRAALPDAEIIGYSVNPQNTAATHAVAARPIRRTIVGDATAASSGSLQQIPPHASPGLLKRLLNRTFLFNWLKNLRDALLLLPEAPAEWRFLRQSYHELKQVDLMLVAGSGQLFDGWGGVTAFPYTLLKWAVLARLARTRFAFVSVGAGPIDGWLSRLFIRAALRLSEYRSFRDTSSQNLIKRIGFGGESHLMPDLAFSLHANGNVGASKNSAASPLHIGINPVPYFDYRYWDADNAAVYADYVRRMADFSAGLLSRKYNVTLFPTQLRADNLVVEDIKADVRARYGNGLVQRISSFEISDVTTLLQAMQKMDLVCAARFHGVLLGFLLRKPVLGIGYAQKTWDLMRSMSQESAFLDIATFEPAHAVSLCTQLATQRSEIAAGITRAIPAQQKQLAVQYHNLLHTRLDRAA